MAVLMMKTVCKLEKKRGTNGMFAKPVDSVTSMPYHLKRRYSNVRIRVYNDGKLRTILSSTITTKLWNVMDFLLRQIKVRM